MKNSKKILSGVLAFVLSLSMVGCGGSSDESSSKEHKDVVEVPKAESVAAIPDSAQKELIYLNDSDLNPTGDAEKSTELSLFEQKGGSIKWIRCKYNDKFDKLASAIMSNKDVPDIFKHEWLAFPSQVIKGMYQPIDSIVDFKSDMWSGVKESADQYVLNGKHYVAPLYNRASSYLYYNKQAIDDEGLEDPYDLWTKGEWNWDSMSDIMSDYVSKAQGDEERYGINGYFMPHMVQQTGKTLVTYDSKKNVFKSNLKDPDIERAENVIYNWQKQNLIAGGWIGGAASCFESNILFYGMGLWAATGNNGPKEGDNWGVVPIPQDPNNMDAKITTPEMVAYMWVKGSTAKEAVKCWYECNRTAYTDPTYVETNKAKFLADNKFWTEEMYDTTQSVLADDHKMLFDYAYGVSQNTGDANYFGSGSVTLTDAIYTLRSDDDNDVTKYTWTQIREKFSGTLESEVSKLNSDVKKFLAENK